MLNQHATLNFKFGQSHGEIQHFMKDKLNSLPKEASNNNPTFSNQKLNKK